MINSSSMPRNASLFAYKIMGLAQRFRFSVWLMLIFFPVNMVLNFREGGEPITLSDFFWSLAGCWLLIWIWIWLGEHVLALSGRLAGNSEGLSGLRFFIFVVAGLLFLVGSAGVVWLASALALWLYEALAGRPPAFQDIRFLLHSTYGHLTSMALCAYILLANRQILDYMERIKVRAEQLEKENLLTRFSALKNQVNPHFLFNSLSILSSLVRRDADTSEKFIDRLSKAYRYILEQRDHDWVPLKTELEFTRSYTFLLQIRFENKFRVELRLDEAQGKKYLIAPLTLQLLLENAVKHNRMSQKEPLLITIEIEKNDVLVVRNNFQPRGQEVISTGVGLQNIINRYALLTDRPVWAGETENAFVIRIPLLTERDLQAKNR